MKHPTRKQVRAFQPEYAEWLQQMGVAPRRIRANTLCLDMLLRETHSPFNEKTVALAVIQTTGIGLQEAWATSQFSFLAFWKDKTGPTPGDFQSHKTRFYSWLQHGDDPNVQRYSERVTTDTMYALTGLSHKGKSFRSCDLEETLNRSGHYRLAWKRFLKFWDTIDQPPLEPPATSQPAPPAPVKAPEQADTSLPPLTRYNVLKNLTRYNRWLQVADGFDTTNLPARQWAMARILRLCHSENMDDLPQILVENGDLHAVWHGIDFGFLTFWAFQYGPKDASEGSTDQPKPPTMTEALDVLDDYERWLRVCHGWRHSAVRGRYRTMMLGLSRCQSEDLSDLYQFTKTDDAFHTAWHGIDFGFLTYWNLRHEKVQIPKTPVTPMGVWEQCLRSVFQALSPGTFPPSDPRKLADTINKTWGETHELLSKLLTKAGVTTKIMTATDALHALLVVWPEPEHPETEPTPSDVAHDRENESTRMPTKIDVKRAVGDYQAWLKDIQGLNTTAIWECTVDLQGSVCACCSHDLEDLPRIKSEHKPFKEAWDGPNGFMAFWNDRRRTPKAIKKTPP